MLTESELKMNKRIEQLAIQAFFDEQTNQPGAELIVRECVSIVAKRKNQAIDDDWNIDEAMSMAEMDLEEHFGIEV